MALVFFIPKRFIVKWRKQAGMNIAAICRIFKVSKAE